MYDTNFIANLLNKKINGTLSSEENVILEHWANLSTYNREIVIKVEEREVVFEDVLILLEWNLTLDDQQFTALTSPLKTGAFKIREKRIELLILNRRNIHEKIKVYRSADRLCHQAGRDRYTRRGSVPQNGNQ